MTILLFHGLPLLSSGAGFWADSCANNFIPSCVGGTVESAARHFFFFVRVRTRTVGGGGGGWVFFFDTVSV